MLRSGNVGTTVFYTDPVDANPINQTESLKELVADMRGGKVDVLVILGGNPAYDAPADFGFADALKNGGIPVRIHHGLYQDETAELCQWHVNDAHYLEAWGDSRAYDGTVSIVQPLIEPLYRGHSAVELRRHAGRGLRAPMGTSWCRPTGRSSMPAPISTLSGASRCTTAGWKARPSRLSRSARKNCANGCRTLRLQGIELNFRRDPSIYDGRFSNNGWLQELPKPMSKLTWDSALLVSPETAQQLGLATKDLVELELNGKTVKSAGLDSGRARRQFGHGFARLRTVARGTRRDRRRLQHVRSAL